MPVEKFEVRKSVLRLWPRDPGAGGTFFGHAWAAVLWAYDWRTVPMNGPRASDDGLSDCLGVYMDHILRAVAVDMLLPESGEGFFDY